jgi:hypothetical protein
MTIVKKLNLLVEITVSFLMLSLAYEVGVLVSNAIGIL